MELIIKYKANLIFNFLFNFISILLKIFDDVFFLFFNDLYSKILFSDNAKIFNRILIIAEKVMNILFEVIDI